jgi:hypothetical protein
LACQKSDEFPSRLILESTTLERSVPDNFTTLTVGLTVTGLMWQGGPVVFVLRARENCSLGRARKPILNRVSDSEKNHVQPGIEAARVDYRAVTFASV